MAQGEAWAALIEKRGEVWIGADLLCRKQSDFLVLLRRLSAGKNQNSPRRAQTVDFCLTLCSQNWRRSAKGLREKQKQRRLHVHLYKNVFPLFIIIYAVVTAAVFITIRADARKINKKLGK